jgi:hypothetical protein
LLLATQLLQQIWLLHWLLLWWGHLPFGPHAVLLAAAATPTAEGCFKRLWR